MGAPPIVTVRPSPNISNGFGIANCRTNQKMVAKQLYSFIKFILLCEDCFYFLFRGWKLNPGCLPLDKNQQVRAYASDLLIVWLRGFIVYL